ncbi:hypothetical protein, partial [Escherichia sp. TW10509]|uniref:hypothetical protein n=1 Tax=Escherichia sp. TW10509 TaxID=754332 RepID=UPI001ED97F88
LAKWLFIYTVGLISDFSLRIRSTETKPVFPSPLNRQNSPPPASSAITWHIAKVAKLLQSQSVHHLQKKKYSRTSASPPAAPTSILK